MNSSTSAPIISILVPIYNSAPYLRQALDSLVNQTLQNLEIICINDGSTDESPQIIQSYAKQDARIKVISKPNTGYGDSMNQGIKLATGKYIGILEPDDWIDSDAFERLTQLAEWYQADVVKANYYREKAGTSQKVTGIKPLYTGKVIHPRTDRFVFTFAPAVWSAIYRRAFLIDNQLDFLPTPGASYQDLGFSFKVWVMAQRVVLTDSAFLHYRLDNSASSINQPGKINCVVEEYASISQFLTQHQLMSEFGHTMAAAKFRNYHWNLQRLSSEPAKQFYCTMYAELKQASREGLLHHSDFSSRHWLALQLMLKNPSLAYRLFRLRTHLHHG